MNRSQIYTLDIYSIHINWVIGGLRGYLGVLPRRRQLLAPGQRQHLDQLPERHHDTMTVSSLRLWG